MSYPKLIVFDLDYTLWPFWCDTHVTPPIKAKKGGEAVIDNYGDHFSFYPQVPEILKACHSLPDVQVCIASRTHAPRMAKKLLELLEIDGNASHTYFELTAWGTSSKVGHLRKLKAATGVEFKDMILFDDEIRNQDVRQLGTTFMEVRSGLTRAVFDEGIELWRSENCK